MGGGVADLGGQRLRRGEADADAAADRRHRDDADRQVVERRAAARRVGRGEALSGRGWIGLKRNDAYRVTELEQRPLLPAWAALLLIVGSLLLAWRVEGR